MLTREYRIPMPLSVEEYKIGQLYMIAKHSHEQSGDGEGVEVITNEPIEDPKHGKGQLTEKRIHLSNRLPNWICSMIPRIFYVTEKAWNYYPYTITEYTCSFIPKFSIYIETRYENNSGTSENCLGLAADQLETREVDVVDIVFDELNARHYKPEEDLQTWKSEKTSRGPLHKGWINDSGLEPIMCSYKLVSVSFEVWGLQTRVEDYVHRVVREVLLLGHRQAVAWLDQWVDMTEADVRNYEQQMHHATNEKVRNSTPPEDPSARPSTPKENQYPKKGWFNWS